MRPAFETGSRMSGVDAVWDPFAGQRPFEQAIVADPGPTPSVPGWLKTALGLGSIAAALLIVAGFFNTNLAWVGGGLMAVSVGGLMGVDLLSKGKDRRSFRLFQIAQRNGWAFRLLAETFTTRQGNRRQRVTDPEIEPLLKTIPELLTPRAGQLIPFQPMALYWGTSASGVPFWMSLAEYEADATLGASRMKRDTLGNVGLRGRLYMLAVAYKLDRDTAMRARLLAEPLPTEGWRDIKTESVEFNRAFSITLSRGDELALLQTLTPAAQTTLIDLQERFKVQLVIDGPTLFMAGQDRIMSEDDAVLARDLATIVDAFSNAALLLKPYAE